MSLSTQAIKDAVKIGEAQALIERARGILCDVTGDNEIDGHLKDAWGDTLPEVLDALPHDPNSYDEEVLRVAIEESCKIWLRWHAAALDAKRSEA